MIQDEAERRKIILEVTDRVSPRLLPELTLNLVTSLSPWWRLMPEDLAAEGIPEPFWAFAWAGGQCLARYLLDNPETVRGRQVIDFGAGGGVVALAALNAGAAHVIATEIDPWALTACALNLAGHSERISLSGEDWLDRPLPPGSIILCGDMSYERELCARMRTWFKTLAHCVILVGDAGRGFIDIKDWIELAHYRAPADSDDGELFSVRGSVLLWQA